MVAKASQYVAFYYFISYTIYLELSDNRTRDHDNHRRATDQSDHVQPSGDTGDDCSAQHQATCETSFARPASFETPTLATVLRGKARRRQRVHPRQGRDSSVSESRQSRIRDDLESTRHRA